MLQINQLIIVSGPSCSGKSTLIKDLITGNHKALADQLEMEKPDSWLSLSFKQLSELGKTTLNRVILHLDIYNSELRNNAILNNIIYNCPQVTVLTIHASNTTLVCRNLNRIKRHCLSLILAFLKKPFTHQHHNIPRLTKHIKTNLKKNKNYLNNHVVSEIYSYWFSFFDAHPKIKHWVIGQSRDNVTLATQYHKNHEAIENL